MVGRIIPADAGSTAAEADHAADCRDHPRRCGEHAAIGAGGLAGSGSSPQMRGARLPDEHRIRRLRIIPADAGSTPWPPAVRSPAADHPRRCGEHPGSGLDPGRWRGSSPQMRGALFCCEYGVFVSGIIPADAGSTHLSATIISMERDHPRGCGEHRIGRRSMAYRQGSSPRMRGAHRHERGPEFIIRIIPADAGSTDGRSLSQSQCADHPRGCGEHSSIPVSFSHTPGSSPRMRGAHRHQSFHECRHGIIPADAGSTFSHESGVSSK